MTTITPEQRQEIQNSGDEPVRFEDPDTHELCIMIKEEVYKRLLQTKELDQSDESLYEFDDYRPLPRSS